MLLRLLSAMDRNEFRNRVISLGPDGTVGSEIRALDIPVLALGVGGLRGCLNGLWRLSERIVSDRPDILQTWMYHANLLGSLAALPMKRHIPLVWNIRRGWLDRRMDKRATLWTSRACACLSQLLPSRIVCCSEAARIRHAAGGYSTGKMIVIPNGFDTEKFRPDPDARLALRRQLGAGPETILVGLVARFDATKDHGNFLRAAAIVAARRPQVRFVLCGKDVEWGNAALERVIGGLELRGRVRLLGLRDDVSRLLAALDVAVSSSRIESFPNAIAEAMACGVPCVATDAGESRRIVGDTADIVAPGDAEALARGIEKLCDAGAGRRAELGAAGRKRVAENYGLRAVTHQYELLYRELTSSCAE